VPAVVVRSTYPYRITAEPAGMAANPVIYQESLVYTVHPTSPLFVPTALTNLDPISAIDLHYAYGV
jgi:hypothetical protein